jgi:glycosyltransferase involved in cell wall biosynthesis
MYNKEVTLAIPTFRRFEDFLIRFLPKYLEFTFLHSILIGDESGEDANQIRSTEWGDNELFQFIVNPERLGAYKNKINLLKNASTDWIALIDSDNEVCPEYFSGLFEYWNRNGRDAKSVYIPAEILKLFPDGGVLDAISEFGGMKINAANWNDFLNQEKAGFALNNGNCVFHKSAVHHFPNFAEKDVMVECKIMNKALVENGYTLVFVPGMKYYHSIHNGSLYMKFAKEMDDYDKATDWQIR